MFGTPLDELMPGAHNAVDVCLAIRPGERVALVADEASRAVAASLEQALVECGAQADGILVESVSPRPMTGVPPEIAAALQRADAGILCVQPQEGELASRMAVVSIVERRRIRYAHMIGVTPMIGLNDVTTETFTQQDAEQLLAFAHQRGLGELSMWSLNRDRPNAAGVITWVEPTSSSIFQQPFEFSLTFNAFTG